MNRLLALILLVACSGNPFRSGDDTPEVPPSCALVGYYDVEYASTDPTCAAVGFQSNLRVLDNPCYLSNESITMSCDAGPGAAETCSGYGSVPGCVYSIAYSRLGDLQ